MLDKQKESIHENSKLKSMVAKLSKDLEEARDPSSSKNALRGFYELFNTELKHRICALH